MNRMTIANGTLSGSAIVRGNDGVAITYDAAGRRRTATQRVALQGLGEIWVPDQSTGGGGHTLPDPNDPDPDGDWVSAVGYMGDRREDYEYRADGYLMNTRFADEGSTYLGNGYVERNGVIAAPVLRATNARDAMGRVSFYEEYDPDGTTIVFNRTAIAYNGASQVTSESQYQRRIEGLTPHFYETTTTNTYGGPGGALSTSSSVNKRDGSDSAAPDTSTTYSYATWDDLRISGTSYNNGQGATHNSTYYYDGLGRLASVQIADGRARTVSFASNPNGQVLSRIEKSAATKNPQDFYYFVDGAQVGELSSNGGYDPARMNYSDSFVTRNWKWSANTTASQPFRWDNSNGTTRAQFGGSGYDPIAPTAQGLQGTDSRYSVREGDSLQSVAASVWGDASLWYLIAEANGLSGAESLPAGTSLIVPDKVVNVHNSSKTFDVYDPNHAAGDLSPTEAKPPKKTNNCGLFGTILVMVVAVVATHYLGPVTGNLVTQGFANLIGQQKGFSWKSLAVSVITHEVTGGLNASGIFSAIGNATVRAAATAITANAVTQGIGVAVGLQKKFDFASVAAAGAGAALSAQIRMPGPGGNMLRTAADAIAGAATRSLVTGTSFGDNILAVLPDVIGRSIGNAMADALSGARFGGDSTAASAVAVAEETVARLPDPIVDAIRARGGELVVQSDGTILVKGYRRGSVSAQGFAESAEYTFGSDLGDAWFGGYGSHIFVDTENPATWTPGANDGEGINFDFAPSAGSIRSDWIESGGTAIRIISGDGGAFLYNGGTQSYSALGLRVSYGAEVIPTGYYDQAVRGAFGSSGGSGISLGLTLPTRALDFRTYPHQGRNYSWATYPGPVATNIRGSSGMMSNQQMAAHLDRLRGGSFGAIAYGTAHSLGASPATQDLVYGFVSPADGIALGARFRPSVARPLPPMPRMTLSPSSASGRVEPYNRAQHYGRSPTAADRRTLGAGPGQVLDHQPPLVQRYYEGDPRIGEAPGMYMTADQRRASAADRSRMHIQPLAEF